MEFLQLVVFRLLPCLALLLFALGLILRLKNWAATPQPLKIPLSPTPVSLGGAVARAAGRGFGAIALLKKSPLLWLIWALFHLCLVFIFLSHLRFFLNPVPAWIPALQAPGIWAGYALPLLVLALLLRRLISRRLLYISNWGDYWPLVLILAISLSGLALRYLARVDLAAAKGFILGFMSLDFSPAPPLGLVFWLHFFLALALGLAFAFGKLSHGIGVMFNPVLTHRDNPRGKRHLNPWDREFVGDSPSMGALLPGEPGLWTLNNYRAHLKERWQAAGTREVLGAGERAAGLISHKDVEK